MYHYVYELTFQNGMKYIGCHSTTIEPELDTCYLGSGKALPEDRTPQNCTKRIVATFNTRKEATDYEEYLIVLNNAVKSNKFYNLRKHVYDKHGFPCSEEQKQYFSKTYTGRKRPEYAKKYVGAGRTPAQIAGAKRGGLKMRGTKDPRKGKPGIKNNAFKPWYYITPDNVYVEVHDMTLQDAAEKLFHVSRHQLVHRFSKENQHKPLKQRRNSLIGYTFGFLPRPTDLDVI